MSQPTLLYYPSDPHGAAAFAHEHRMQHRTLNSALGEITPSLTFGVEPYFLDPIFNDGKFHMNHWQAHIDALTNLPGYFGATTVTGVFLNQNLIDTNLDNAEQRTWWTFQNHMEHRLARSVLPSPW